MWPNFMSRFFWQRNSGDVVGCHWHVPAVDSAEQPTGP